MVEMLSNTSHDLRTPLTVIKASLHLIKQRWTTLSEEQRDELLIAASNKVDELAQVITHLELTDERYSMVDLREAEQLDAL
jgi:K+-sensing histidine kinase KdpD